MKYAIDRVDIIFYPFRIAVPFGENTSQIPSNLSPKRDCSIKRVDALAKAFHLYRNACAFFFFAARGIPPLVDEGTRYYAKKNDQVVFCGHEIPFYYRSNI